MYRGFAIAGEYPLETVVRASQAAESAKFSSFWLSQPPQGNSLAVLAHVAARTGHIALGVGAIPLTMRSSTEIVEEVRTLGMPEQRLLLGIGSGIGPSPLARLETGVESLKANLDLEIVVAPLGPRMCQLAGQIGDSVLLNWLTSSFARQSVEWIRVGADKAGRATPPVRAYVRCAFGVAALPRLEAECDRYGALPHYAAHFLRQGVSPVQTAIAASNRDELQSRLSAYQDALDEVIVRGITANDQVDETLELVDAASPTS